ncbi:uncharacterized protein B0I36DRAFT_34837 [Microdochium trichocladiopsis]|uniref:Uncharacterized protein n=1 Tax=Microdochium trichocladiopsis TaxID=1682393 RepID=A0A9P9BH07_9PEZI|nr:uncharacterized protein B0I36DRAFT_34837 [Microdochium trichocladiopsis]KAH7017969.1 hypothetical protein B0I36DRAFT_34837 [Microdochium trichocladiopsis]
MSPSTLPVPQRILSQNILPVPAHHNEPVVETTVQEIDVADVAGFGGMLRRGAVANSVFPAENDGLLDDGAKPGSGIVYPGGTTVYYLDLAPGSKTPMHRTVSADYMIVLAGSPTLVAPKGAFSVIGGKATYTETVDTVVPQGSTVVQRGQFHAWENRTEDWVRFVAVVVDAQPQVVVTESGKATLGEAWL